MLADNEGIITEKDITDATESSTEEADAEDCIEEDDFVEPPPLPKDYEYEEEYEDEVEPDEKSSTTVEGMSTEDTDEGSGFTEIVSFNN